MHELLHHRVQRRLLLTLVVTITAIVVAPTPHAYAEAPACRYTISTDTVLDNDTGLTWQQAVDAASYYTYAQAISHCENLALAGGGWRLPSIKELQSLVDEGQYNPAIDPIAFPNDPFNHEFWSATLYAGDPSHGWYVLESSGYVGYAGNGVDGARHVRCVR